MSTYPKSDETRLREQFDEALSNELIKQIRVLVAELDGIKPDWSRHDLNQATEFAVAQIKFAHPELGDAALSALAWAYSFGHR